MANYKCFSCAKEIPYDMARKRVRCPFCGGKLLYKKREMTVKLKAR